MLSNKPYLVRAFFDWIVDSGCTPYIVANANHPRCVVPKQFIEENGEITLDISPAAVRDLRIANDVIKFCASFSGNTHIISIPIDSILAIFPQEYDQQGMFFDDEEPNEEQLVDEKSTITPHTINLPNKSGESSSGHPHLRLVE